MPRTYGGSCEQPEENIARCRDGIEVSHPVVGLGSGEWRPISKRRVSVEPVSDHPRRNLSTAKFVRFPGGISPRSARSRVDIATVTKVRWSPLRVGRPAVSTR